MSIHAKALLLVGASLLGLSASASAVEISIACGGGGEGTRVCKEAVAEWERTSGHTAKVVVPPNSTTEQLALYQQFLAAGSADIDVFQVDVIWPGMLAEHLIDLTPYVDRATIDAHFPAIVQNNTVDGRLVAMPWYTDAGLLYYRKDLLEKHGKPVPATWQELQATAKEIQDKERALGNGSMWGFVYQAKAYEGLTCNALEWIDSWGGGALVADDGTLTVDNPRAAEALAWAASTVGTIAPDGVLNYAEEDARGVWQSGNAVFMRNWPYAWALGNAPGSPIKDKIGVAPLPKGGPEGKSTGTLGGWQLSVSRYSDHQDVAADLVRHLTSPEQQKRRAIEGANLPTIESLYEDEQILEANPFFGTLRATFTSAVARPSRITGARYNQVSAEFFGAVHEVLSKKADPATTLAALERKLDRLSRGGRW